MIYDPHLGRLSIEQYSMFCGAMLAIICHVQSFCCRLLGGGRLMYASVTTIDNFYEYYLVLIKAKILLCM
jgi:hypothetical protein